MLVVQKINIIKINIVLSIQYLMLEFVALRNTYQD